MLIAAWNSSNWSQRKDFCSFCSKYRVYWIDLQVLVCHPPSTQPLAKNGEWLIKAWGFWMTALLKYAYPFLHHTKKKNQLKYNILEIKSSKVRAAAKYSVTGLHLVWKTNLFQAKSLTKPEATRFCMYTFIWIYYTSFALKSFSVSRHFNFFSIGKKF